MPLQSFQASDGSTVFYDPATKKIMTEGGKQDSFYTAGSLNEAQSVWNQRLANKASGASVGSSGMNSLSSNRGAPTIDLNAIYNTATNTPEIQALKKEVEQKKAGYNTAVTSINNNPYASEATRLGKISKLDNTAQREIQNLEGNLAQKYADAQTKVNIAAQQYNINNQQYQNELSKLNLLISSGALLNASGNDIAQIGLATGMSSDMIKGIQNKMKSDNVKPQVITNTDDSGRVTVSVIDAQNGNIISQRSLGKIGNAQTGGNSNPYKPGTPTYIAAVNAMTRDLQSVSGADRRVAPENYVGYRQEWVQAGFDPSDFDAAFKGFVNPQHAQDYQVGFPSQAKTDVLQQLGL